VHLTKDIGDQGAADNLRSIVTAGRIDARSPMGWARDQDDPEDQQKQSQRVVCFSETPLEHIYSMVADIAGRQVRLRPYGVAFTKLAARLRGANPVWYIDMTPGHDFVLAHAVDDLKAAAVASGDFHHAHVARILPFFEQIGTWPGPPPSQKEFWWEREWRKVGAYDLFAQRPLWICPEGEQQAFRNFAHQHLHGQIEDIHCIDAMWGIEEIIARLAWLGATSPFGSR
jgi:hypothetical protein